MFDYKATNVFKRKMSTIVDFTGLDMNDVFVALRARAKSPYGGWQDLYARSRPHYTDEMIRSTIGSGWVDRIDGGGVIIKTSFHTFPKLDSYTYDRDNGTGAMKSVRDFLLSVTNDTFD